MFLERNYSALVFQVIKGIVKPSFLKTNLNQVEFFSKVLFYTNYIWAATFGGTAPLKKFGFPLAKIAND